MRTIIAFLLFIALSGLAVAQKTDGDILVEKYQRCGGLERDLELRIAICTKLIDADDSINRSTGAASEGRGVAFMKKGEYDRAIADFDFVVKVHPSGAIYYTRGEAYALKGEHDRALSDFNGAITRFDEVIKVDPRDALHLADRCFLRAAVGQVSEALADCDESLRLRPNQTTALRNRGLVHLKLKQFDLAIADYDALLRVLPNFAPALFGRGMAARGPGRADEGAADMTAATRIDPGVARWYDRFGAPAS